jgi:hypothetical protein
MAGLQKSPLVAHLCRNVVKKRKNTEESCTPRATLKAASKKEDGFNYLLHHFLSPLKASLVVKLNGA